MVRKSEIVTFWGSICSRFNYTKATMTTQILYLYFVILFLLVRRREYRTVKVCRDTISWARSP